MASDNFFTIFKNYFKCGCCCFTNEVDDNKEGSKHHAGFGGSSGIGNRGGSGSGSSSPFSFDDLSNPLTPLTSSSSSSSLEDYRIYQRPKFKPYVGIIPANYYSD